MFIVFFIVLLALWLFGFTAMHAAGFAIHILLILAIVALNHPFGASAYRTASRVIHQ